MSNAHISSSFIELSGGPKESHFSILRTALLHGVVVPNTIQNVAKYIVVMYLTSQIFLKVGVGQGITCAMYHTELCLNVCPSTLNHIYVQCWIIRVHKVQLMIYNINAGQVGYKPASHPL